MIKILHVADIHFGNKLYKNSRKYDILQKAIKSSFDRAVLKAIEEDVDLFIISGDLFDSKDISYSIKQDVILNFLKLKEYNILVLYSLGNHDCYSYMGDYFLKEVPDNVVIFYESIPKIIEKVSKDGEEYTIVGIGHSKEIIKENLIKLFPKNENNKITIGIAHANVIGLSNESENVYLPTTISDLVSKNYNYWALGHIHKRQKIANNIYYSGSIQGLSVKESEKKGGYLVKITEITEVYELNFSEFDWYSEDIEVRNDISSVDELKKFIEKIIDENLYNEKYKKRSILRLNLIGKCRLNSKLISKEDILFLERVIRDRYDFIDVSILLNFKYYYDLDFYKKEENFLGYFLNSLNIEDLKDEILKSNLIMISEKDDLNKILDDIVYQVLDNTIK